jgi:hypothetical protein
MGPATRCCTSLRSPRLAVRSRIARRGGGFVLTPLVVALLRRKAPPEYQRLLTQAAERPRWWNRRLAARVRRPLDAG